ncbi:MAG TPA: hypothetical protein VFH71_11845 [Rhodanobacteraceae bacterium]|nr:hypothetical protein [Rhodanobacteraceae bacterium]
MRAQQTPLYIFIGIRGWMRIGLGLPILVGGILALALLGWLFSGLDATLAPAHWLHQPSMIAFLLMRGALCGVFAACVLYVFALLAFVIGDIVMTKSVGESSDKITP